MTVSSTVLSALEALGAPAPAEPEKYSGTDSERAQP